MPRSTIDDAALETEIGRLPALSLLELRKSLEDTIRPFRAQIIAPALSGTGRGLSNAGRGLWRTIGGNKASAAGNRRRRSKW